MFRGSEPSNDSMCDVQALKTKKPIVSELWSQRSCLRTDIIKGHNPKAHSTRWLIELAELHSQARSDRPLK
jgi:hypothetical protein